MKIGIAIACACIVVTGCQTYRIPAGGGDPFRLGVAVCQLQDDPEKVAARVLEGRRRHSPKFDVDLYVAEKEEIGTIVGFLNKLSSAGVTNRVRVVVSTSDGPVTFENFNNRPISAFNDFQKLKEVMEGTQNNSLQATPQ